MAIPPVGRADRSRRTTVPVFMLGQRLSAATEIPPEKYLVNTSLLISCLRRVWHQDWNNLLIICFRKVFRLFQQ
uniref:Uncharacterized protein n=1 Tax=Anguilla anguilla TaxID=7936 RepID=A0A0E9S196_ANGAN